MNLYAESSGVLAWILDESSADRVGKALGAAEMILTSELTLLECDRALVRLVHTDRLSEVRAADDRARLGRITAHWSLLSLSSEIVERARRAFPAEPIRTLDALHLASALVSRAIVPGLGLLTLDHRVSACGRALGFQILPEGAV